ncbi:hypothetical protein D3C86_2215430 [compost metagenome]
MTKTGTEKPRTAKPMMARSIQLLAFQAAITPSGTAIRTVMTMVTVARTKVGSTRWPISLVTGWPE